MKDAFGNSMQVFVVSGRSEPPVLIGASKVVSVTVLACSKLETKKMMIVREVGLDGVIIPEVKDSDFSGRAEDVKRVFRQLSEGDKSVGKFFIREALTAYRVKDKLRRDQAEEAVMGAYLVPQVTNR